MGPGLLYAGAAVGVSHLVQSTKAGAMFGMGLIWAVFAANILKYPFFEFGPRYAAATGNNLLHGYRQLGRLPLLIFTLMTLLTMFVIQAAVTLVTAGLAIEMTRHPGPSFYGSASGTEPGMPPVAWGGILLLICVGILWFGKYRLLDKLMKFVIILLSVTTLIALIVAFAKGSSIPDDGPVFEFGNAVHVTFLIALMGWMPAPLDISVWHSVWSTAKHKTTGIRSTMRETLLDFKIGYWSTLMLAIGFVLLGALTIYGTDVTIEKSASGFARQLISLYTSNIGQGAYGLIAIAAFTTMFSTTLTCLDAFPRVLTSATRLLLHQPASNHSDRQLYRLWIGVTVLGTMGVLLYFFLTQKSMISLVTFITVLSFILAPVIAFFNYRVVTGKQMPEEHRPGIWLRVMSWAGMAFLVGFCAWYLYHFVQT